MEEPSLFIFFDYVLRPLHIPSFITHQLLLYAVSTSPSIIRPRPTGHPSRLCPKKRPAALVSTSLTASLRIRTIRLSILTAPTDPTAPPTLPTLFSPPAPQIPPTSSHHAPSTPTRSPIRTGKTLTARSWVHRILHRAPAQPTGRRQTSRPTPASRLTAKDLTVADRKARPYTRRLFHLRRRNPSTTLLHTHHTPALLTAVTAIANRRPLRRLASPTVRRTSATSVNLHQLRSGQDPIGDRRATARTLQHRDQVVGDTAATLSLEVITRTRSRWFPRARRLTRTHFRQMPGIP